MSQSEVMYYLTHHVEIGEPFIVLGRSLSISRWLFRVLCIMRLSITAHHTFLLRSAPRWAEDIS
jgi:hypothetical protein